MSSPVIHLTLIDDASDEIFGESAVESEALPESFRDDTVLHIGEDDWNVLEADPISRAEYEATGRLELRLRRIEIMDPRESLYSLPTISNDVPPAEGKLLDGSELLLHSDDWRQIEFVTQAEEGLVEEELDIIAQVHQDAEVDGAFKAIHLRRRLEEPLRDVRLTLHELQAAFPRTRESGVVFETSSRRVDHSFSFFVTPHLIVYGQGVYGQGVYGQGVYGQGVYGQGDEDRVEILAAAIVQHDAWTPGHEALQKLAQKHNLLLVDWCRCRKASASDASFEALLRASSR